VSETVFRAYLNRHTVVFGGSVTVDWIEGGKALWFEEGPLENRVVWRVETATGETTKLGAPPSAAQTGNGADALQNLQQMLGWGAADRMTPKTWTRADYLIDHLAVPEQLSPDAEWFVGITDNNIVLRSTRDGLARSLTSDGTVHCRWDLETLRWRALPGLRVTYKTVSPWSPDSLALLAYRRDVTGVFRIPRMNWLQPFEQLTDSPYQKAGAQLDRIAPVFVELRSGRQVTVRLETTEDRYIQLLAWLPDGAGALIIVYHRDFKDIQIVEANRETGAVRTLLSEHSGSFVKIQHEAMFSGEHGFRQLPDNGFLWLSTRDGWNHLYRYDSNGRLVAQLTSGEWSVYDIEQLGPDHHVYFTGAIDITRPYDVHVCRVPLEGGAVEQLTREKGIHGPTFSPDGLAFLDTHSMVDRPVRTDLVRADGTRIRVLSEMDITALKEVGYTPPEEFTVKAADRTTDLWGVMYKPFDFDPGRSYPLIQCAYAGPQGIETRRFFAVDQSRARNLHWALAQLGYIVVCLDSRGTPGRSKSFHDVVEGSWEPALTDQAFAIRQLCERHAWIDVSRVGIIGHSWGGYFATYALLQAPDTYHAAAACSPGYDPWHLMINEPYLGLPLRNRQAYDRADIARSAKDLRGRLLIVAGTSDDAVMGPAMRMVRALIDAGIDHECVLVPNAFHHFSGADEEYLVRKLVAWFDRHVKKRTLTR